MIMHMKTPWNSCNSVNTVTGNAIPELLALDRGQELGKCVCLSPYFTLYSQNTYARLCMKCVVHAPIPFTKQRERSSKGSSKDRFHQEEIT
jgi:hypothetical protein